MPRKVLTAVLASLLITLLVSQAVSLFVFPVPDSIRWFGDESWLMTESIATVETGRVNHPHALSSTLAAPKAFLPVGAAWIRTAVYGVPGYLTYPEVNPVYAGRMVTWILSLILVSLSIWVTYRRTLSVRYALVAALILSTSLSFFFSSHSARPDLLKGLIILAIAAWVASDRFLARPERQRWFIATFTSLIFAIWLPFHLYFHLIAVCGVAFVLYRGYRSESAWLSVVGGVVAALALTALVQYILSGELLLGGPEGHAAEFNDVTRDIPILRLFSLSAQLSVLSRRFDLLWNEAPLMFALLPLTGWALWSKRDQPSRDRDARMLVFAFASFFVWYFLQRIHPAYTIQMLPLFIVAAVCGVQTLRPSKLLKMGALLVLSFVSIWAIVQSSIAKENSARWANNGIEAVERLRTKIKTGGTKPMVMVEASATMPLLADTSILLMTTHFQFFPIHEESITATLDRHDVEYCILFNTAHYGYDRHAIDPLVKTIIERSDLIAVEAGNFFDISKDYFATNNTKANLDTLFLYKLRK